MTGEFLTIPSDLNFLKIYFLSGFRVNPTIFYPDIYPGKNRNYPDT
jgi:hypothetical protein